METSTAAKSSVNLRNVLLLFALSLCTMKADSQKVMCRQRSMDLMFVVDGSRSVRPRNFRVIKDTVKRMVDSIESIGPKNTQIGLIQYSSRVRMEFKLDQYKTKEDIKQGIDEIDYMEMGTMTGLALKFLVTQGFTKKGGSRMDPEVLKVAVVITDGRSQDRAVSTWQKRAVEAGIILYAIGIGRRVMHPDLLEIASEPKADHVYSVQNFSVLSTINVMLAEEICDVDECKFGNHTCSQICINTEGSYVCDCHDGFILHQDGSQCIKIDPCMEAECVYKCEPLSHDGYRCICPPGHRLNKDEKSCDAPVPQNLEFSEVTHTSMRVTWELDPSVDSSTILHYQIFYIRNDGKGEPQTQLIKDPTIILKDLDPGTPYLVTVAVVSEHDFSEPVQGVQSTLFLGETRVELSDPTITTLIARWEPAGGDLLSGYELLYKRVPDKSGIGVTPGEEKVLFVASDTHELRLDSLEPGTLYMVRVTPVHGKLKGIPGEDREKTKHLAPPSVVIPQTSLSTAIVEWTDIGADADYYTLEIYKTDSPDAIKSGRSKGNVLLLTFRDLTPDTEYTVTVIGHVAENGKEFASPVGSATGRTKFLPPPTVTITNTSLTTADVVIAVSELGIFPQFFTLSYCPVESPDEKMEITIEQLAVKLRELQHDTEYMVKVVSKVYDDDKLFTSLPGTDTERTKTLDPPKVQITGSTTRTLDASWMDGDTVQKFIVMIKSVTEPEYMETIEVDSKVTQKTFMSLIPATKYVVTVFYEASDNGNQIPSPNAQASGFTLPEPPQYPQVQNSQPKSITVIFDPSEGGSDWYEAKCVPKGDDPDDYKYMRIEKSDLTVRCVNLIPGVTYEILIVTVFRNVRSDRSSVLSAMTEIGPVLNFDLKEPTTHSLLASWEPPAGIGTPTNYEITYRNYEIGSITKVQVPGFQTNVTLDNLRPDSQYQSSIIAFVGDGRSPAVSDTEKTLPDVIDLQVLDSGFDFISVEWPKSKVPDVTSYKLQYVPAKESESSPDNSHLLMTVTVSPDTMTYVIMNAIPATRYHLTLNAVYPHSESDAAPATAVTMPPPPGPLNFTNVTDMGFVVHWGKPEYAAEPIGYTVRYHEIPKKTEVEVEVEVPSGEILNLDIPTLFPDTKYFVEVSANYRYDIVSESTTGEQTTLQDMQEFSELTCDCKSFVTTQSNMQETLEKLVKEISRLSQKIERIQSGGQRL